MLVVIVVVADFELELGFARGYRSTTLILRFETELGPAFVHSRGRRSAGLRNEPPVTRYRSLGRAVYDSVLEVRSRCAAILVGDDNSNAINAGGSIRVCSCA